MWYGTFFEITKKIVSNRDRVPKNVFRSYDIVLKVAKHQNRLFGYKYLETKLYLSSRVEVVSKNCTSN